VVIHSINFTSGVCTSGFRRSGHTELWFAFAADDDALPPPQEMRLKAYGFIGAAQQIGMAWLDGNLPLTIDEVIDQLVDMFYRISGIAPPSPRDDTSG
jgi:hypothetical protein